MRLLIRLALVALLALPFTLSCLAQKVPGAKSGGRLELFPESGHALFVDEPERFNSLLEELLATLPPGARP